MNADEALRPVGGRGEPRDRDRGGVGADEALGLQVRAERLVDLALDLFVLDGGFDDATISSLLRMQNQLAVATKMAVLGKLAGNMLASPQVIDETARTFQQSADAPR